MKRKMKYMISFVMALCILMSLVPMTAMAATKSGKCGENVYWSFDYDTATMTISGTGGMDSYAGHNVEPWVWENGDFSDVYLKMKHLAIEYGVTETGHHSFGWCQELTDATVAESVTFFSSTVSGCKNLTRISLPASLREIAEDAFAYCNSLSDVYYAGSEWQWNQIKNIDEVKKDLNKIGAVVHYNAFLDVTADDYFYKSVDWAVDRGITGGVGKGKFGPNDACTRGQVVTFLWAAAGKPSVSGYNPFSDVRPSDYYYNAVLWAAENGITGGFSDGTFRPNAPCTRAQVVTFLYASAGKPYVSGSPRFSDVASGAWYCEEVQWAVKNDITGGIGGNKFGPDATCTRAQVVTFLYKYYN